MVFSGLVFKKFLLEMQYQFGKFRYVMYIDAVIL
jgi:hypothetical protein